MSVFAFGLNHTTAPVPIRERVVFAPEELEPALRALSSCDGINEAAIVSTCNRTDLYCEGEPGSESLAIEWFRSYHALAPEELLPYLYTHQEDGAIRHLLRVASGLDSLVLGEPQILGQVKQAHAAARSSGALGGVLDRLFQQSFSVAKQVRSETGIGSSPISVAYAAVSLARQIFGELGPYTGLLVGAGETVELAARHLHGQGLGRLIVANRTLERAQRIARELDGYAIGLDALDAHLGEADIIVSSTASQTHVISRASLERALAGRRHRPVFIADIAVPRDVEAAAGELPDVYLYSIDDLEEVIAENRRSREAAAREAEELIEAQVVRLARWLEGQRMAGAIRTYREQAGALRDEVLAKALHQLARGRDPEDTLRFLAHTLTNKLIHTPTTVLREAAEAGDGELIDSACRVLGVDPDARPGPGRARDGGGEDPRSRTRLAARAGGGE